MADIIILPSIPAAPPAGQKLPEATLVSQNGAEARVTVNTAQPKAEEKVETKQAEGTKTPVAPPATPEAAKDAVTKAGLDMSQLSAEFAEKGELSAESFAALEKAGIPKTQVDAYIDGQKAVAAQYNQRLAESIGGEESLKATFEWAAKTLPADEIALANSVLASGNEAQAKMLLAGLHARREATVGREPAFVGGQSSGANSEPAGYESTAQMVTDMNSPAYRTDPAFRDKVMRKLAAAKF